MKNQKTYDLLPIELQTLCYQKYTELLNKHRTKFLEHKKQWRKAKEYYSGNQRGFWSTSRNEWVWVDIDKLTPTEQSVLVVNNQIKGHVRTIAKEFSRAIIKIKPEPKNDTIVAQYACRLIPKLIDCAFTDTFSERLKQYEAKLLILTGNAFRYVYLAAEETDQSLKDISTRDYICANCGYASFTDMMCENCGSTEFLKQPEDKMQQLLSFNYKIKTEIVDPEEILINTKVKTFAQTDFLFRIRKLEKQLLDIEDSKKLNDEVEFVQCWLKPNHYKCYFLQSDFKSYKQGTPLIEIFPDGLYFEIVNDKVQNVFYNEDLHESWIHVIYDNNPASPYGLGIEDAIQLQQLINEITSLIVENILYNASPTLIINPRLINPASISGKPRDIVLMNEQAMLDSRPDQAFASIPSLPIAQDVYAVTEGIKRDMREQTGAYLAFNPTGDPYITTATGASIARDSALALLSLSLSLKTEADKEWVMRYLKLAQKVLTPDELKHLLGRYNELEIESFYKVDLDKDINYVVENSSWQPQTTYERIQNLQSFLSAFGLPLGFANPAIPPAIKEYAMNLYQVPIDIDELQPDIRVAKKRLTEGLTKFHSLLPLLSEATSEEEMMELAKQIVNEVVYTMKPDIELDNHEIIITTYLREMKTDEGLNWNPLFQVALRETINLHKEIIMKREIQKLQQQQILQTTGEQVTNIPATAIDLDLSNQMPETVEPVPPSEPPFQPLSTVPIKPVAPVKDFVGDEDKKAEEILEG